MSDERLTKYRVWLRSTDELRRGAFPDRGRAMWNVERVEVIG